MSVVATGDDGRGFRVKLAVALVAEIVYLVGRSMLISAIEDEFHLELFRTAWRLLFIVIYVWLFLDTVIGDRDRQPLPRHPLLMASIFVSVATIPLVHQGSPFVWHMAALDIVAIPIVAMREELFYRAILQSALEKVLHPVSAVLAATLLFALSHVGAQPMNPATISSFVACGVVLGLVYQHTRNLWIVVVLHGIADFLVWMP